MSNQGGLSAYQDERAIKDELQLVNLVKARFDMSKSYRQSYDEKFDKNYQYYRSYQEFDTDYWYRSQLFMPYIFGIIESITPDFVNSLIGGDDFFNVAGGQKFRRVTDNLELLMKFQINEKMQFYTKILMWIKSILIFGNGIVYTGWRKKTKKFTAREWISDPILGAIGSVPVSREVSLVNDPYIDTVYMKNFFPQPYKESIEDMGWCIERAFVDWDFILKLKKNGAEDSGVYKNLDQIKDTKLPEDYKSVMYEMNTLVGIASESSEDPINKPVVLKKYWNEAHDRLIIVANDKVVIRDSDIPFVHKELPYAEGKDYPLDKEFYAISDVDLLMPLQDKCNDLTNLRMDNIMQIVNNMYIVQKNAGVNADDVISRPFGIIWSDDINAVKPMPVKDVAQSAFREVDESYQAMQRATGAWEYYQGATPSRQETATGIIKLQEMAMRRFGYRIKLLQKTAFKRILTQIMQLNQENLPMDYELQDFETGEVKTLQPWDIAGKTKIQVSGSTNLINLEERMFKFFEIAQQNPAYNQMELSKRMLDVFDLPQSDKLLAFADNAMGLAQGANAGGQLALPAPQAGNPAGQQIIEALMAGAK